MSAALRVRTLYDDWLERRYALAAADDHSPYHRTHLRVLDYLLHRYKEDAASLEPLPPPLKAVYVNHRAIIINHHLREGTISGVKSRSESHDRMSRIVARLQVDSLGRPQEESDAKEPARPVKFYKPQDARALRLWKRLERLARATHYLPRNKIAALLNVHPHLPEPVVARLVSSLSWHDNADFEGDLHLLVKCRNSTVAKRLVEVWYRPVCDVEQAEVHIRLQKALLDIGVHAAPHLRPLLDDQSAKVRLEACWLLGELGELRDISLLADLLTMPTTDDEHRDERTVLANAMYRIAQRHGA
jgi:hypothetical protein